MHSLSSPLPWWEGMKGRGNRCLFGHPHPNPPPSRGRVIVRVTNLLKQLQSIWVGRWKSGDGSSTSILWSPRWFSGSKGRMGPFVDSKIPSAHDSMPEGIKKISSPCFILSKKRGGRRDTNGLKRGSSGVEMKWR